MWEVGRPFRIWAKAAMPVAAVLLIGILAGCDSGSDSPEGDVKAFAATADQPAQQPGPAEVETADGILCDQPYALCSEAKCEASRDDPGRVTCSCQVFDGYSFGHTPCGERAPAGDQLVSTFSLANVARDSRGMLCPGGSTWANCLDMKCELDPDDPTAATCKCQKESGTPFGTLGGNCDKGNCDKMIYSAAGVKANLAQQFANAMKKAGQQVTPTKPCPTCPAPKKPNRS